MPKYTIPAVLTCPRCGNTKVLRSYCRLALCDSCEAPLPFDGFLYRTLDSNSSEIAYARAEMDCPNCRGTNMFLGPEGRLWKCFDCGYHITDYDFQNGTFWFCDNCDTFLNVQSGFTDVNGTWKCKQCGSENDVSEGNIF